MKLKFLPQLFADKTVLYAGQAYGIIAAKSQEIARLAASKIKLIYTPGPRRKPMITIHDVKNSNDKTRIAKKFNWPATQSPGTFFFFIYFPSFEVYIFVAMLHKSY